jgi:hypothetical protein
MKSGLGRRALGFKGITALGSESSFLDSSDSFDSFEVCGCVCVCEACCDCDCDCDCDWCSGITENMAICPNA